MTTLVFWVPADRAHTATAYARSVTEALNGLLTDHGLHEANVVSTTPVPGSETGPLGLTSLWQVTIRGGLWTEETPSRGAPLKKRRMRRPRWRGGAASGKRRMPPAPQLRTRW